MTDTCSCFTGATERRMPSVIAIMQISQYSCELVHRATARKHSNIPPPTPLCLLFLDGWRGTACVIHSCLKVVGLSKQDSSLARHGEHPKACRLKLLHNDPLPSRNSQGRRHLNKGGVKGRLTGSNGGRLCASPNLKLSGH